MAAADFFFLSERTNFLFFIQISNKFRENPSSPSAVRVVVDTKYNTHTHSINNNNNNNNMSDNEGGGAAADVDFNDDLFTCANVRFIQCYRIARKFSILFLLCVLIFFFETTTNQSIIIIFITNASTSHEKQFETHSQMLSPSTRLLPIA